MAKKKVCQEKIKVLPKSSVIFYKKGFKFERFVETLEGLS